MVNHGASRGCETCKRRHKKCDEGRPVCNRCIKSNRACLGYKDSCGLLFRHHNHKQENKQVQEKITPPKSSMDLSVSKVDILPSTCDVSINDLDDAEIERSALDTFFEDYCIESADPAVSRGFLDGLKSLVDHLGESSDVACAAKVVSLAGTGNRLCRPTLLERARQLYGDLLRSFHATLSNCQRTNTIDVLVIAVLLGLYEIVTCNEQAPDKHLAHVKGVSAILFSEDYPFNVGTGIELLQVGNPFLLQEPLKQPCGLGLLCQPSSNEFVLGLDNILIKFTPVYRRAGQILDNIATTAEELEQLRQDAVALDAEYLAWPARQSETWKPRTIGVVDEAKCWPLRNAWPGNVDVYFDHYVAAVWNTYRKTHMMVLDTIVRCTRILKGDHIHIPELERARKLAEEIIASIPFHLDEDTEKYLQRVQAGTDVLVPGKPVAGLLLLHPAWVVTRLSVVPPELKAHVRERLVWIANNMGISQASFFASVDPLFPFRHMAVGHTLIWAGMLIRRE